MCTEEFKVSANKMGKCIVRNQITTMECNAYV